MDWQKQTEDMVNTWMSSQRKMWEAWMGGSTDNTWQSGVETWHNSVKNMIETQALWAKMWARSMGTGEVTKPMEETIETWSSLQLKMWDNWFSMVSQMNPDDMTENMREQYQQTMESWQKQMQQMMDAQAEWTKQWADTMKGES